MLTGVSKKTKMCSPKGWRKVAGGRSEAQTTGKENDECSAPRRGARGSFSHPFGVRPITRRVPVVYASLRPPATF